MDTQITELTGEEVSTAKVIAYVRVSTEKQELKNQKLEILEYARQHDLKVDDFIEIEISSRKDTKQRRIEKGKGVTSSYVINLNDI